MGLMKAFYSLSHVLSALLVVLLGGGIFFLLRATPTVGGVDFFYYLCVSRDATRGLTASVAQTYGYFPGFKVVWSTLMEIGGVDLIFLQRSYVIAILVNTLLVGAVCRMVTSGSLWSLMAATTYLFTAIRVEGLEGGTEIFSTIPFLAAILLWIFLMKSGKRTLAVVVVSVLCAATLFSKQQAGLLLVGGLGVVPLLWSRDAVMRLFWRDLALAGAIFIGAVATFFALEGGGLEAFRQGLGLVKGYDAHGSLRENLGNLVSLRPLSWISALGVPLWCWSILRVRSASRQELISGAVLGIVVCAGLASLYQFSTRAYLHYALLTMPCMAIAIGISCFNLCAMARCSRSALTRFMAGGGLVVCVALLILRKDDLSNLFAFARTSHDRFTPQRIMEPFDGLCAMVPARSELFVFPPRRNVIHWFCDTRSSVWPGGYGWGDISDPTVYRAILTAPALRYVFVIEPQSVDYNSPGFLSWRGERFEALLQESGYSFMKQFPGGALFVRGSLGGQGG